jgi:hypothetical protein
MAINDGWNDIEYTYTDAAKVTFDPHDYSERETSDKAWDFGEDRPTLTKVYKVRWQDQYDFLDALLGRGTWDSDTGQIARRHPQSHPVFPHYFCVDARTEADGFARKDEVGGEDTPKFDVTNIVARFEPAKYRIGDDADPVDGILHPSSYLTFDYSPASQFVGVPGTLKYVGVTPPNDPLVKSNPGYLLPRIDFIMTWHRVPNNPDDFAASQFIAPNLASVMACLGRVNTKNFFGNPPGTTLFVGQKSRWRPDRLFDYLSVDGGGFTQWDLDLCFQYVNPTDQVNVDGCRTPSGDDEYPGFNYKYFFVDKTWHKVVIVPPGQESTSFPTCSAAAGFDATYQYEDIYKLFTLQQS